MVFQVSAAQCNTSNSVFSGIFLSETISSTKTLSMSPSSIQLISISYRPSSKALQVWVECSRPINLAILLTSSFQWSMRWGLLDFRVTDSWRLRSAFRRLFQDCPAICCKWSSSTLTLTSPKTSFIALTMSELEGHLILMLRQRERIGANNLWMCQQIRIILQVSQYFSMDLLSEAWASLLILSAQLITITRYLFTLLSTLAIVPVSLITLLITCLSCIPDMEGVMSK